MFKTVIIQSLKNNYSDDQPFNSTGASTGLVFGFLNEKQANIYKVGPRWTQDWSEKSMESAMSSEVSFVSKYEESFTDFDNVLLKKENDMQKFPITLNDEFEFTAKMMVSD